MARYQPHSRTIELAVSRSVDPKVAAARVASIHRQAVEEAEGAWRSALGSVPLSETFVDGREGARLESVRLDGGVILTRFEMLGEVVEWIYEQLVIHAPELTGRYKRSIKVFADNEEVDPFTRSAAREWVIGSGIIYARKIEKWFQLYEEVARQARGRFGNIANIRDTFTDIGGDSLIGLSGRDRKRRQRESRVPVIKVTLR